MAGQTGKGAKLEYSIDGGSTWVKIVQCTKFSPFKIKGDSVDISDMDSPSSYREKMGAMIDAGQIMADMNYNNGATTHKWLVDNVNITWKFRITFPGANTGLDKVTFSGFVVGVGPEVPFDNKMTCQGVIELSGLPVWS